MSFTFKNFKIIIANFFLRYGSFKILIDLYFRAPKGSNLEKVKFWHDKLIFFFVF